MGVFRQFPYSNFHEMNMDEIIKIIKNMLEEWANYHAEWDSWMDQMNDDWSNYQDVMNTAWKNMQDFINNYFDNLDVQEEINNKIVSMIQTGEFGHLVNEYIPPAVSAWLNLNIKEPTGVVIDTSLTVAGACADAKATGDAVSKIDIVAEPHLSVICAPYQLTNDGFIYADTGEAAGAGFGFRYSDYIDISDVDYFYSMMPTFATNNNGGLAFYDSDKVFISGVMGRNTGTSGYELRTIVVPENAVYTRICYRYSDITTFYAKKDDITKVINYLDFLEDYLKIISNPLDLKYDGSIDSTTGELALPGYGWLSTDYISIAGMTEFEATLPTFVSANVAGIAFFDSAKTYISGVAGRATGVASYELRKITVPNNSVYVRFSIRASDSTYFYARGVNSEISNDFAAMQLFEKIGVIGDSIACGWAKDKNGNNSRRNVGISWVQQMARRLGCTAYNLGASGVDPIEWFQSSFEFYEYCYPQYQSVGECDLYIIGLGLNGGALGSTSDINQSDYTQNGATFYGQYARIIQMINAEHPNAIVMCLTEPTTAISPYDQAVRDICALNFIHAELLDLENDYYDLFNSPEILAQHQPDGLHFTPYGYSLLADAMMVALNDYISKHSTKFKYVGVATV